MPDERLVDRLWAECSVVEEDVSGKGDGGFRRGVFDPDPEIRVMRADIGSLGSFVFVSFQTSCVDPVAMISGAVHLELLMEGDGVGGLGGGYWGGWFMVCRAGLFGWVGRSWCLVARCTR